MRPLVVIPAFNEALTIGSVLERVAALDLGLAVAVIDDGSSDATAGIARRAGTRGVRLPFNIGYGVGLLTSFQCALRDVYECVVQLDGDWQHQPGVISA